MLALSACTVAPPESQMVKVADMAPSSWTASKEGKAGVDRAWVKRFNDPALNKLVAEAVSRNPDMKVAAERVFQARQAAYMAGSDGRLKATSRIDGSRRKTQFLGLPFAGSETSESYQADLEVSWNPDLLGRVRAGSSAAMADAQAVEMDRRGAEVSLAAEVCKAWFALGEASEQLALARETLKIRKDSVEAIADRFERNLGEEGGSAGQLRLAQTDEATAMVLVSQRQGEFELAQRRLELLAGRYPAAKVAGRVKLTAMPARPPAGVPSGILKRRPDILAAERRYASTIGRIQEAKLAAFPILNLTTSVGTASEALEKLANSNLSIWSLAGDVSQTLLTGGLVKGEQASRASKQREQLASLQSVVLRAFGEVENALSTEQWLGRRITELERAYTLSKEAEEAASDDYRQGTGDVLTLLAAQSRRVEIGSQLLTLKRVRLDNRVNLHLALGGEFSLKS